MKVGVVLTQECGGGYIYGVGVIEKDYVSMYDARDKVTEMLHAIFNGDVSEVNYPFNSSVEFITGGKNPYKATLYYKTTEAVVL